MGAIVLFAMLLAPGLQDQPFCAVRLEVVDTDGNPLDASFKVMDMVGDVVKGGRVLAGKGEICDLEFGYYTIKVEQRDWWPVILPNVSLDLALPRMFKVTLNPTYWTHATDLRCRCYYRTRDENRQPLAGVRVSAAGQLLYSDAFGRVEVIAPGLADVVVTFDKPGYEPVTEKMNCTTAQQKITASYAVLKRILRSDER